MADNRPLIMVTNDDGVTAPGFHHLIKTASQFGTVIGVAPEGPQSGQSSAITVESPLRIRKRHEYDGADIYSVSGTPTDCVKLGLHAIMPRKPDLILSGVNHGSNSGNSVVYSGTMGAVIEGCMVGIPSIGFSLLHHAITADFAPSTPFIQQIIRAVLEKGLPEKVCLNVNIPAKCQPKGIKVTVAAEGYWTEEYKEYTDPSGKPFYMLTGHFINSEPDNAETDIFWLDREYISVTPVSPDMTARSAISEIINICL